MIRLGIRRKGRGVGKTEAMMKRLFQGMYGGRSSKRRMCSEIQNITKKNCNIHISIKTVLFIFPSKLYYSYFHQNYNIHISIKTVIFIFPSKLYYSYFLKTTIFIFPLNCNIHISIKTVIFIFPTKLHYSYFHQNYNIHISIKL